MTTPTNQKLLEISADFEIDGKATGFTQLTDGHINNTFAVDWVHSDGTKDKYLLQQINTNVFRKVDELIKNINGVCEHIKKKVTEAGGDTSREALTLIKCKNGGYLWDGCWRMYNFIKGASAHQSADAPGLLFNAAKAFGKFQRQLADYPADTLFETIPNFHNTVSRYNDFMKSVELDAAGRAKECVKEIETIKKYEKYAHIIVDGIAEGKIPLRVTHNDTKLNNVMMDDKTNEGVCVIDLDTVMPGSLLYDFGDSIRFAACNSAEDEPDLDKVYLRLDLFEEYTKGFLCGVGDGITEYEKSLLPMSSFILTYELVLRFLGDYLNGDTYFKIGYPKHNLVRARAQLKLAEDMFAKLDDMKKIVENC
ncbi:MAG: aminoglycoside phosphotransferase family protein [Clostridia bacterium]|nr:aminoglycoside phosphotransferase family protein [Clostridia bacterium]